jgi:hypothetical protein
MMNAQERLIFLARNYNRLQNLRLAPFCILLIASPWTDLSRVGIRASSAALCICFAWYWLLKKYYRRRYGRIERKPIGPRDLPYFLTVLIAVLAYFLMRRLGSASESVLLIVPAGFILAEGLAPHNIVLRRTYYLMAGGVFLLTLLPDIFRRMPGHQFFHAYDLSILGAVLLILAILDHILLIRSFPHPQREIYA